MRDYSYASHTHKVLQASKATRAARAVLAEMCRSSEFNKPTVTITKPQLVDACRYSMKTIKEALKVLLEEGSIEGIMNQQGGRGVAPTYRLVVIGAPAPQYRETPKTAVENKRKRIATIMAQEKCGYGVAADKWEAEQSRAA
jgi:hypothetical protein